ncbi:PREDICTED: CASP-like protein 4D1 [Ipomoea nil]|uniref:CASP-like protein 4D1 n=1 Tax=Ipomoea nil TaxID=35883 RepID=UPI0009017A1B|nr:PREDICTED: CASP-like protein 4D1 [Ipomoea nil]
MGGYLHVLNLALRILSFASLVVSIIVFLSATSGNNYDDHAAFMYDDVKNTKFTFNDFFSYRYSVAVDGIGIFYSFLQIVLTMVHGQSEESSEELVKFNLYADEIISVVLGTGAAAGFGLTLDLKHLPCASIIAKSFLSKMLVASSFSLGGFASTAVSSIVSIKIFHKDLDVYC